MVKKPIGNGTHLKKGRVVVCGNFQQVQPGEENMCEYSIISDAENAHITGVSARMGSSILGCFNGIPVCSAT